MIRFRVQTNTYRASEFWLYYDQYTSIQKVISLRCLTSGLSIKNSFTAINIVVAIYESLLFDLLRLYSSTGKEIDITCSLVANLNALCKHSYTYYLWNWSFWEHPKFRFSCFIWSNQRYESLIRSVLPTGRLSSGKMARKMYLNYP